jgi:SAM-dependent methyltransferase
LSANPIRVKDLLSVLSIEELNETAETYFARLKDPTHLLAKPYAAVEECAVLLTHLGALLKGSHPLPGMAVLDFGCGSGWLTRILTQLRLEVFAIDPSRSALNLAQRLMVEQPPFGRYHQPKFLVFDGRTIPLPSGSVHRVFCNDAFHHVPNPEEALQEIARVLRPGGIAAFAEGGPRHSLTAQAQQEMRLYRVIENDIIIRDVWGYAQKAGFAKIFIAVLSADCPLLSLCQYEKWLAGDPVAEENVNSRLRSYLENVTIFFLEKSGTEVLDSRTRSGLRADLSVELSSVAPAVHGTARIQNCGSAVWLPHGSAGEGGVALGVHLLDRSRRCIELDFARIILKSGKDEPVLPGEEVSVAFILPALPKGQYSLEFDMVSEGVTWFAFAGSPTVVTDIAIGG